MHWMNGPENVLFKGLHGCLWCHSTSVVSRSCEKQADPVLCVGGQLAHWCLQMHGQREALNLRSTPNVTRNGIWVHCSVFPGTHVRGYPKIPQNLFIKNSVFILTCLKFSHLQRVSIWCNTPIEIFFPCSKLFFSLLILVIFSASVVYLFHLLFICKTFPFGFFFILGNKRKVA